LNDVSFDVRQGEIVAILGANGAGKSTIMNSIMGLLRPSEGTIVFDDIPIHRIPTERIVRMGLCLVPEGRRVFPNLTVFENLSMGAYARKNTVNIKKEVESIERYFPILLKRRFRQAGYLSGGEQQMLAIGRALMARPRLLLLDEPSMGLAPLVVEQIFDILRTINQEGVTLLLVEQNAAISLEIASKGFVLENGSVTVSGTVDQLISNPKVQEAYLGG
jgi:branched-chain amino acid transport system ATP-binding protein